MAHGDRFMLDQRIQEMNNKETEGSEISPDKNIKLD